MPGGRNRCYNYLQYYEYLFMAASVPGAISMLTYYFAMELQSDMLFIISNMFALLELAVLIVYGIVLGLLFVGICVYIVYFYTCRPQDPKIENWG
jgi:hypothetical protein